MAASKQRFLSVRSTHGRATLVALLALASMLWLPPGKETRLLAAVSLTTVTPYGASAGVTIQIIGTGFDAVAAKNSITFTPASGPAITVAATAVATLDPTKGLRRLSVKVPADLAIGPAAVRVVNTTTGESAAGATIQIVALSLPDVTSGTRGAENLDVAVNGTPNMQFVAGRTTVTFGAGVTVTSVQVTSPTSLIATVTISSATPLGGRTVLVATNTQTAQLMGAFTVTAAVADAPPTANAGPDQTLALGSTATLNGSASTDPEGHALTYAWSFLSKPATSEAELSDPTSVSPTFVVDRSGTYELQLIVNDGVLSSAVDVVRISTLNSRPIANAGPDQTTTVNGVVRLDGTVSSDPDGDPLTFAWSFQSVPLGSSPTLSNAAGAAPSFVADRFGEYVIQLVVSDGTLASIADLIKVSTLNSDPVANAGPDQTALVGGTATLSGGGSSDVDGDALTFKWSFTAKPPASLATLADEHAVAPTFVVDAPGIYVIQLIVNDGSTDSAADTVTVTTVNSPPVAKAGPDQVALRGDVVQLTGAGSTDVDGNPLRYAWSLTTTPTGSTATLSDPTAVNPTFVVDRSGAYAVQLIVNDGTVDSAPDVVSISTQNGRPVANAGAGQTVAAGATVQLDGSGSTDPNGDALTFKWSLLSRPQGSSAVLSNTVIVNPTFVADAVGNYVVQLIVNDGELDSDPATVTVSTSNSKPTANAGPDQTAITASVVQLNGSSSFDPDGTPLQYAWSLLSRPAGSTAALSATTAVNPTFLADLAGTYVAQLMVSDGVLTSDPDTITIQVGDGADLAIQFEIAPLLTPAIGSNESFSLRVDNLGPSSVTGVTVLFKLPSGYTPMSAPSGYDAASGVWTIGTMARGQFARLGLSARVEHDGPYDVTAAITGSSQPDADSLNNTVSATIVPDRNADLRLWFETPPSLTPAIGSTASFGLRLDNLGPSEATGVTALVTIPAGYTLTGTVQGYDNATGIWTIGTLAKNSFRRLSLSPIVRPTGPYDLTAAITASSQPDPDPANNTVSAIIVPDRNADLRLWFETPPPLTPPLGSRASFGLRLDNLGPSDATGITALVPIPAGYTLTDTVQGYDNATGIWTIGSLARGAFRRLGLSPLVRDSGPYDLTATITASSQPDPDTANNTATVAITPNRNADLNIAFFNPPAGDLSPGKIVSLFLEVRSAGPASTSGVTARFLVPPGYRNITGGPQVGTYDPSTGLWAIGAMPASGLARLIFSANVNDTGFTGLTADVTSGQPDPNLANNAVTIPPINRPPVLNAGADRAAVTHTLVTLDGTASSDPEADPVVYSWTLILRPANSTANLSGALTTTPTFTPDQPGRYIARLSGADSHDFAGTVDTVTVDVSLGDRAPAIISTPSTLASVGLAFAYDVEALEPDAGDVLTFSLDTSPAGMTVDPSTGLVAWTPSETQAGPMPVVVRVHDSGGLFATQAFTIQVSSSSNHAPTAVDDAYDVRLDESLSVNGAGVLGNDSDGDGVALSAKLLSSPANGTLEFSQDGTFTYTPHVLRDNDLVQLDNVNLATRVPGALIQGIDSGFGGSVSFAADDNPSTSWRANLFPVPHLDVVFPIPVTVTQLQVLGTREAFLIANQARPRAGIVQLFDVNGAELFTSGVIDLPLPLADAIVAVPTIAGVRRAVVTITENERGNNFSEIALSEFRVIGSAAIRRPHESEPNLHQLLPTKATASSTAGFNIPEAVMDDGTYTTWYATSASPGEFIELTFPVDVTVTGIETNNPGATPDGFGSSLPILCRGTFTLSDASGTALYTSAAVATPFNDRGIGASLFTLSVPSTAGVRRVRYTLTSCDSGNRFPVGFSEIRVLGTAPTVATPAFVLAKKFQSLIGREAHSTPIVVNLTDDNHDGRVDEKDIPDIVVPVESTGNQLTGEIKAISGDDGRELFTTGLGLVSPWSELAAADIDGSGAPTIVAVHSDGNHLIAFDRTGAVKWISDANPMPRFLLGNSALIGGAISIANLTGGARPHIIVGSSVFDADGKLIGDGRTLGGTTGGIGRRSALSAVGDVDLDGTPEIIAGPTAYRLVNGQLTKAWQRTDRTDGYVAIANFDNDPAAEIVVVGNGAVYMLNHDGTDAQTWNAPAHAPVPIPGGGDGGSPLVVDVDGDGAPEIGVAGQAFYTLFNGNGSVRWQHAIGDRSSHSTGSIAFDLDGDGRVEIIYRDEQFLRVFRGSDGVVLAKRRVGSATWSEEPVVADVDNDGHAEIVVSSDLFIQTTGDTGVIVFEDVADKWTRTRRIWNQHGYHVTNVNEDATIPVHESPHWLVPALNGFRTNMLMPGEGGDGVDSFAYVATDGVLESNVATVRIAVRTPNSGPQFTSTPVVAAASGVAYAYAAQASDPDAGDVFTFSLPAAPSGMTVDPNFGLIRWMPTAAQLGPQQVIVRVSDAHGLFALQAYTVQVGNPVTVPSLIGQSPAAASSAIAAAGLAQGTVSTQTHPIAPEGTVFSQTPVAGGLAAPGSLVDIAVSLGRAVGDFDNDHDGFTANQGDCDDGRDDVHPGATDVPGNGIDEDCSGADTINPGTIDADHDGFTPLQGDCNDLSAGINPGAVDVAGNGIDENCNGADSIAGDGTFPTAAIASPDETSVVALPVEIIGTASDAHLLRYRLELSRVDATTSTIIGSGTAPVVNGVLGRLDPTLLENGLYRVLLIVEDTNAQVSFDQRVYQIDGAKVGHSRLSFVDLEVPVAGIPITVVRTYDSRVNEERDFGFGWSLQVRQGLYQSNREPGIGWQIAAASGPFGLPCQIVQENLFHVTQVWLSDREVYTFKLDLTHPAAVVGGCVADAGFVFVSGTAPGATLEALDGTQVIYTSGGEVRGFDGSDDTGLIYNPRRVRLTTRDGRVIDFERGLGITRIADANGNALSITPGGIVHSSGKSISFQRDGHGRITAVTDPAGRTIRYAYDSRGNLVTVTSRSGSIVTHAYSPEGRLETITNSLGQVLFRAEYGTDGRLAATRDGDGAQMGMIYDLEAATTTVTGRTNGVTTYQYDPRGNITHETDALGRSTAYAYGAFDTLLSTVDTLGHTTTSTYDDQGNLVTTRDPLGHVTSYTYNPRGQVLTTTDPLGRTSTNTYDSRGNILTKTDATGQTWSFAYDDRGNPIRQTDPAGNSSTFAYDAAGLLVAEGTSCGGDTRYEYDALGNRVRRTVRRTLPSGATEQIVTRSDYDAEGRPIRTTYNDGFSVTREFDAAGNTRATTDKLGRRTTYTYTGTGLLASVTFPDGGTKYYTYDGDGHVTGSTDEAGKTTTSVYDALGRLVRTTAPDGSTTERRYDELGQVIEDKDELGHTTGYAFDAAGRQSSMTDALGQITRYTSDDASNLISETRPDGRTRSYEYDVLDRRSRVVFPDGTSARLTFDFASRPTSTTDQAGLVTRYGYDACGRLTSVIDPLGQTTSYGYDEMNNRISQTDPAGDVTRWEYDGFGRVTRRVVPMGNAESFSYDPVGNVTAHTDFNGQTTRFTYDASNRLLSRTYPDGSAVTFTYSARGERLTATDARGITKYEYDAIGQLTKRIEPDGASIAYAYDAAHNRTAVTVPSGTTAYAFDTLNRLDTVTEQGGAETHYAYDAVGNLLRTTYPNGTRTERSYDSLDRVVRLEHRLPDSSLMSGFSYTFGPVGNRLSVAEDGGRSTSYSYDSLYRLMQERRTEAGQPDHVTSYTYDRNGNRISKLDSATGATSYIYDTNDRLLTENGQAYTYDANGNQLARPDGATFVYDFDNRLVRGDTPAGTLRNTFDADGGRVRSDINGAITNYLVDGNLPFSQVVEERDAAGTLKAANVVGLDLIRRNEGGQQSYFHFDAQNNVRQLTTAAGAVSDTYNYDGFGSLVSRTGASANPYLFAGERFDPPLGEYNLRARYYDPRVGRFSSVDPALPDWSDPRSLNRYVYSFSDPINRRDPSGEFGLAEVMISVSISGILAQIAQPGLTAADVPALHIDYSGVDGYVDPYGKYTDMMRIRLQANQIVRSAYSPYNVKVLSWGEAAVHANLSVAKLKDKTIHVIPYNIEGCDDMWGCAPLNGAAGHAFMQDIMINVPPTRMKKEGRWKGDPNDGLGVLLGFTISHEAGHTYGLAHSPAGIMKDGKNQPLKRRFSSTWDAPSANKLKEVLGLKQP